VKVYVAAPYAARDYIERVMYPVLAEAGHECTSTWALASRDIHAGTVGASLDTEHDDAVRHAEGDLYDVARSGALIGLTAKFCIDNANMGDNVDPLWLHTGGRHVEMGYALHAAMRVRTVIVGEPENIFQRTLAIVVPDLDSAIRALA
jgi:hypothetical protein